MRTYDSKNMTHFFLPWLVIFLFCLSTSWSAPSTRPNVVLFLADDYGYGDISFEGNTQIQTPNIDRIAREGTRFSRFYQSAAACAPTRASLLTGRYFYETGVWDVHFGRDFLRRDENTLGNLLRDAGYRTGVFGKWHSGKTDAFFGWNRGFDTSVHTKLYDYFDSVALWNNKLVSVAGPMTDVVGDQAVAFIRENRNQPFFCYVPFAAVHEPLNCPPELFEKYRAQGFSEMVARLYGMIETLDNNVGKVLGALDELHLNEHTIVMFMVDDGFEPAPQDLRYGGRRMTGEEREERERGWGYRLRGSKATIAEGGQISPFYVRWPGKAVAGREIDALSGVIDIYPTLAELAGASYPKGQLPVRGRSLAPAILGGDLPSDFGERRYFDGTNFFKIERSKAIQNGVPRIRDMTVHYKNYKYVRTDNAARINNASDTVADTLYDLSKDPREETDLSGTEPELTSRLRAEALAWRDEILATGRAFQEATFPVGSWQERGTPINADAAASATGSLERANFRFAGWTEPGSALTFNIDVLEAGRYEVELFHTADTPGAAFEVSTEHASATAKIDGPESTRFGPLKLPAGEQKLSVRLKDLNGLPEGMKTLDQLVVERIPDPDSAILRKLGFTLQSVADSERTFTAWRRNETHEFRRKTERDTFQAEIGEVLRVEPFAGNLKDLKEVRAYIGFEQIHGSPYDGTQILVRPIREGRHTLNVEFVNTDGVVNSARVDLLVKKNEPA